jgi:hypothetical protein
MRPFIFIAVAALGLATSAEAQAPAQPAPSSAEAIQARIAAILGIPARADEVRRAGVPDSTVRGVLDVLIGRAVPPEEVEQILVTERDAAREHGPTDNFGAFVQARLDQGLRGRELAAAIRAEHVARGKGPQNAGQGNRPDAAGKRPDDAGAKGKRPDDAGASGKRADDAGSKGKRPDSTGAARGKRPNS